MMEHIIILGALFTVLLVADVAKSWRRRRHRRNREDLRHVIGAERWWGRR